MAALADAITCNDVDIAITAGDNMAHLSAALPETIQIHHGADSDAIRDVVLDTVQPGDVVMVKGFARQPYDPDRRSASRMRQRG